MRRGTSLPVAAAALRETERKTHKKTKESKLHMNMRENDSSRDKQKERRNSAASADQQHGVAAHTSIYSLGVHAAVEERKKERRHEQSRDDKRVNCCWGKWPS